MPRSRAAAKLRGMTTRRITTKHEYEASFQAPLFLLFKHSPTCPISARAFREYEIFAAAHADVPTAWVHVIDERPLARDASARTGVEHQSPQALLLAHGKAVWNASHDAISRTSLAAACGAQRS
ncbi:MAG: bacillithiol system redox-active protein YtxJ [Planctomycetota bacterium]|nr:MAG: bacillithiol system redox-active protein YtxJ [Planctomycetota bacterium]